MQCVAFAALFVIIYLIFRDGIDLMVNWWSNREEYSHGFLIPLISGFLIYQRSDQLRHMRFTGSWLGVAGVLLGLILFMMGEFSSLYTIVQYAFLAVLYATALAIVGWRAFLVMAIPLFILFFMVPLPNFLYNNLSAKLQLISSAIGVWVIRLFDITVYLEGNVIDLGTFKLQVVEACNGLRYLFPLMTLGFIMAYFYQAALWKRLVIFFSTIPITILMNSFRIGVIGVTVEYWGQEMAEGFLHDFEGWVIFMACFGVLFLEMWLLMRLTGDKRPLNHVFGITMPEPAPEQSPTTEQRVPLQGMVAAGILALALVATIALPERSEDIPARTEFLDYPLTVGAWRGEREIMEQQYIDTLKFTDYVMANYRVGSEGNGKFLNWYLAYYESQRKGQSAHSPRSCIPGGGWQIRDLSQRTFDDIIVNGQPLKVNRVLISYGDNHQLVYYWFQQRGRVVTNEYLVKWWLFWDALTKNRTDGALVRLTAPYRTEDGTETVDAYMQEFLREVAPKLDTYVPN